MTLDPLPPNPDEWTPGRLELRPVRDGHEGVLYLFQPMEIRTWRAVEMSFRFQGRYAGEPWREGYCTLKRVGEYHEGVISFDAPPIYLRHWHKPGAVVVFEFQFASDSEFEHIAEHLAARVKG